MNYYLILIIALALIFILHIAVFIYKESKGFVVEQYCFETDKSINDFNFVFFSDLHEISHGRDNEKLLDAIDDISPDVILIGGDVLTSKKEISEDFYSLLRFIKNLSCKHKVIFVPGNHERALFDIREWKKEKGRDNSESAKDADDICRISLLEDTLNESGVPILRNESLALDNNITVHGLDLHLDYFRRLIRRKPEIDYLKEQLGTIDLNCFNILLAHDPEHFDEYSMLDFDLVLSGHLHGGIVRVPGIGGVISPQLKIFPKYDSGVFEKNNTSLLITRGIGYHSVPVRVFNKAEICNVIIKARK